MITVATVLVYSNTFDATFHFDDHHAIVQNASLRDLRSQWPPSGSRWLGYLSFALNYRVGGLAVFGYHLVNLLIHGCNGLLVFWLTASTLRTPALRRAESGPLVRRYLPLAAGLVFALHPIATQAVTYIVQRFASLATLFFLLSLALYIQARLSLEADRPSRSRAAFLYCLSLVAAAAAMNTKEISLTLPFAAAGYELLFFRPRRRLLLLAPLAATALLVPLGLTTQGRLGDVLSHASELETGGRMSRSVYLLTQSRVVVAYLRLLLLPVGQNIDHDFRLSHSPADPGVLCALALLLSVVAFALFLLIRARRTRRAPGVLVFFGVGWFFVTLSVESIVPIRDVIFEHRLYLPNVGGAVVLGTTLLWGIERLQLRIPLALQAAVALLCTAGPLGIATYVRNFVWKDEVTLWSDAVAKSPEKARPHNNLGNAYQAKGQLDDAVRECREALRIEPGRASAHNNLGNAYQAKGQLDDAVREYLESIRLQPGDATAHHNLGYVYKLKDELDDALREYREALRIEPWDAVGHYNLGKLCESKGELDEAVREFREALRLAPGFEGLDERFLASAHKNLGVAFQAKGQLDDAVREYREALRLVREVDDLDRRFLASTHDNLGLALMEQGRTVEGSAEIRRALELKPNPLPGSAEPIPR